MPVALIEAQLAGVPVVATDVGSVSEVIENNKTGFVVEKNLVEIVAALEKLVSDSQLCETFSKAAIMRAGTYFAVTTMADSHAQLYVKL